MESKHCLTLELPKVLDRLADFASFSAGIELCRQLEPSSIPVEVKRRLAATREARLLLASNVDVSLGGIHDVRPLVEQASRSATLLPQELLDIRSTLMTGRDIHRTLSRLSNQYPLLSAIAARIVESAGVIAEIGRCIDDRGEVRDEASPHLETIRRELRLAHDRLQDKLARILTSPRNGPYLQEAIITMRDGRYVVPIKSDFKGRIPGIVHDQSRSGETLFIEPIATVELNNRWRELQLQEENEIRRVLLSLSSLVAEDGVYVVILLALAPGLPGVAVAVGGGAELGGFLLGRQRVRAIVMHCSTNGRTSLAFWIVVMIRPLTLGLLSSSSASRSVRNSALARLRSRARWWLGIAAELAAFSSMSHGRVAFRSRDHAGRLAFVGRSRSRSSYSDAGRRRRQPHAQPQADARPASRGLRSAWSRRSCGLPAIGPRCGCTRSRTVCDVLRLQAVGRPHRRAPARPGSCASLASVAGSRPTPPQARASAVHHAAPARCTARTG